MIGESMPKLDEDDVFEELAAVVEGLGRSDVTALHQAFSSVLRSLGLPEDLVPVEVLAFRRELSHESDRGMALFATAHLDDRLGTVLRAFLVDDTTVAEPLFNGTAAFATFSARIDVSYLLGLIPVAARRDLHLIRKIRNDFAHGTSVLRFEEGAIASRCLELHFVNTAETPRARFTQSAMAIVGIIEANIRLLNDGRKARCTPAEERRMPNPQTLKRMLGMVADAIRKTAGPATSNADDGATKPD
jgi:DNA-binding MltR family transcriptional regulator